jgi:hypothetical protein
MTEKTCIKPIQKNYTDKVLIEKVLKENKKDILENRDFVGGHLNYKFIELKHVKKIMQEAIAEKNKELKKIEERIKNLIKKYKSETAWTWDLFEDEISKIFKEEMKG